MDNNPYYISRITRILQDNPQGMTVSDIADELSMSRNTIGKYVEIMYISGTVEIRIIGKAKLYHLSSRIPVTKLLSMLSLSVIQTDNRYLISDVNLCAAELLVSSERELIRRNIIDLLTMQGLKAEIRSRILSPDRPSALSLEIELNQKDSTRLYWLTVIGVILNDGNPGHIFFIEDVHDWKVAEEKSRKYESLFKYLAGEIDDAVFIFSQDLIFSYVNPSYARFLGKDPDQLIGEYRGNFLDNRSVSHVRGAASYVASKDEPYRSIVHIRNGNDLRWYDERLFPIISNCGDVIEILGVSRDISGFQEGGSAKILLSSILDLIHEAVITTTPIGRILSWNHGAELMTGYPADELVGSMAHTIITPELNDGRDIIMETVDGNEIIGIKAVIRARGGRKKRVFLSASQLSVQGGIVSGVCIVIREHQ